MSLVETEREVEAKRAQEAEQAQANASKDNPAGEMGGKTGPNSAAPAPYRPVAGTARDYNPRQIFIVSAILMVLVIGIILAYALRDAFHTNPYGDQLKIDNFASVYQGVPEVSRDALYNILYTRVQMNLEEGTAVPTSSARIREDRHEQFYDEATDIYEGLFIVDIPAVEQSYKVWIAWTNTKNNPSLMGDTVNIECPAQDDQIYENFTSCFDPFAENRDLINQVYEESPLIKNLPIRVSYFDRQTGRYIEYNIVSDAKFNNETKKYENSIIVEDHTGHNYENAMERIRQVTCSRVDGQPIYCNPNDYNIVYEDQSAQYNPTKAGE